MNRKNRVQFYLYENSAKWFQIKNNEDENVCSVRLLKKLLTKQDCTIMCDRLFLMSVQIETLENGTKMRIQLEITYQSELKNLQRKLGWRNNKSKMTDHFHRTSAVSALAKKGLVNSN
jgi:hypothetical protein